MTLAALAAQIHAGELSPREAVEDSLRRIEELNPRLNLFLSVRAEEALAEAESAPEGPLRGVPIGIKDVIDVAGAPTTCASALLADNVAAADAASVARLRAAGAIVVGKLNTHEFAYGATTTSPAFGAARNPWDPSRICGGSSGGSGAAVAARMVAGALGTDTAGSIRIPACYCGVTGLRPTHGLVPADGVFPVSWTLDAVGPLAPTAEDVELLLDALAPERPRPVPGTGHVRVGVVRDLFERAEPAVATLAEEALAWLPEPCPVPGTGHGGVGLGELLDLAGVVGQLIMLPEATQRHLPWLRSRLPEYSPDVRGRLLAGLFLPATAYVTGLRARRWYLGELRKLFERYDVLVHPAMPAPPPPIETDDGFLAYRRSLIPYNSPWSLGGLPVLIVPCGFVDGLPIGLALVGRPNEESTLLALARAFQQATIWHERRPDVATQAQPSSFSA